MLTRAVPSEPLISVVLPVFNGGRYLREAIESIQAQSYTRWELIVVDNESADESAEVADQLATGDGRIRLVTGIARDREPANVGIGLARGELIARMDQDDVALPHRFALQLEWMRQTGAEICGGWVRRFGARDGVHWFPESHPAIANELLFTCALSHPTVIGHAAILRENRYSESVTFGDYELWTRLAVGHRMGNVPEVLLRYRCHSQQMHVVHSQALTEDRRRLRRPYCRALLAAAGEEDATLLERVAERRPFTELEQLERAGELLLALAQPAEQKLRARMFNRWRTSCRRSAQLGPRAYRTYARLARHFGPGFEQEDRNLRAACALRLRWNSRLDRGLRRLR